jgi:hypothetical protein
VPFVSPCPNCGEQCHEASRLLYCPECRKFVGRISSPTSASGAGHTLLPQLSGSDLSPSGEILDANSSLERARDFEKAEHFREAARLYAGLGLVSEAERMEHAISEHPTGGRELPED